MKNKSVSPFLFIGILGILAISCAFISKIPKTTDTTPSAVVPTTSTEVNQNPEIDSHARFVITVDEKFGYIDQQGKIVIEPQFIDARDFYEGLAAAQDTQTELWGYVDSFGKYVISPKYTSPTKFSEGLAFVQLPNSNEITCIDQSGNEVFELSNVDLEIMSSESMMGVAGISGYSTWYEFHDGIAIINTGEATPNYVDRHGNLLFPPGSISYGGVSSFSDGLALVLLEPDREEISIIDKKGNRIAKVNSFPGFSVYLSPTNYPFVEGVVPVFTVPSAEAGFDVRVAGYVDRNGNFVIPPQFLTAYPFSEGLAAVRDVQTELWGYIDHSGTLVIPFQFTWASVFSEGLAPVQKSDGKCGFIDKTGTIVLLNFCSSSPEITYNPFDTRMFGFHNGLAYVSNGIITGYIDKQGNFVYIDRSR